MSDDDVSSLRGVVHSGHFTDERNLSLIVGYPHPDSDHGGPGGAGDWQLAYDASAYRDAVDCGDEDCDHTEDDATFELRSYGHLACCEDGVWSLTSLPGHGSGSHLGRRSTGELCVLTEYNHGGSAYYATIYHPAKPGKKHARASWETLEYSMPQMADILACFSGDDVLIAGTRDHRGAIGLGVRDADAFVWRELGVLPKPVTAITASNGHFLAGIDGAILEYRDDRWCEIHSPTGRITFLGSNPDGMLLAGTDRGVVIAGVGQACRQVADVGAPVRSAAWFGEVWYVTTATHVFRCTESGPVRVDVPAIDSIGSWPTIGRLFVGSDRLWLAGSHHIAHSSDGTAWTRLAVR